MVYGNKIIKNAKSRGHLGKETIDDNLWANNIKWYVRELEPAENYRNYIKTMI